MNYTIVTPRPARLTAHRQAVLDVVSAQAAHLTAAQVYDVVCHAQPRMAFATVYNALHYLVAGGYIAEVRQPNGVVAYDRETAPHDHIVCRHCGRLDDVPPLPGQPVGATVYGAVAERTGYSVERHRVEFSGVCPSCRAHEGSADRPRREAIVIHAPGE